MALLFTKITPHRLHTRLCRWIYNYGSAQNKGIDWVIDYQPVREIPAVKLLISTKEFIGWNIFFLGYYELETDLVLSRFIKEGMYVVEAGAHIGSETVLLCELVGEKGKVYAFEPNPAMLKRLRLNVDLNDFAERVITSDVALGDTNNSISFFIDNEKESNQGRSSKYKYGLQTIEITARQQRLDDWGRENNIPRIDFIKMDVQGAEIDILHGAAETIARHKPIIFAEASSSMQGNSKYSIKEMFRVLVAFGYSVHRIGPNGTLQPMSEDSLVAGNWLATQQR